MAKGELGSLDWQGKNGCPSVSWCFGVLRKTLLGCLCVKLAALEVGPDPAELRGSLQPSSYPVCLGSPSSAGSGAMEARLCTASIQLRPRGVNVLTS